MKYKVVFNIAIEVENCSSPREAMLKAADTTERLYEGFRPTVLPAVIYENNINKDTYFYHPGVSEYKKINSLNHQ
jgi:hypothetical protein